MDDQTAQPETPQAAEGSKPIDMYVVPVILDWGQVEKFARLSTSEADAAGRLALALRMASILEEACMAALESSWTPVAPEVTER